MPPPTPSESRSLGISKCNVMWASNDRTVRKTQEWQAEGKTWEESTSFFWLWRIKSDSEENYLPTRKINNKSWNLKKDGKWWGGPQNLLPDHNLAIATEPVTRVLVRSQKLCRTWVTYWGTLLILGNWDGKKPTWFKTRLCGIARHHSYT